MEDYYLRPESKQEASNQHLSDEAEHKLAQLAAFDKILASKQAVNDDCGLNYTDLAKFAAFTQDRCQQLEKQLNQQQSALTQFGEQEGLTGANLSINSPKDRVIAQLRDQVQQSE